MKSQICHLPASFAVGGFRKRTMPSASMLSGRMLPCSWEQILQFLPLCPWCLLNFCPSAGAQREWVHVSACVGPLRRTAWNSRSFCLPQPQSSLFFTARSYGDSTSWHWRPGLGSLRWGWDPSLLIYPSQFLLATHGCRTSLFCISAFSATLSVVSFLILWL